MNIIIGLLEEVPDLHVTNQTTKALKFEWSEPYTLVGVPVLGYNTMIQMTTMRDQTAITAHNSTVYKREIEIKKEINDGFCTFVNITIAAINMAGEGNATVGAAYFAEGKNDTT